MRKSCTRIAFALALVLPTIASAETGFWISRDEIMQLPTSGKAWEGVLDKANDATDNPQIHDQDDPTNVRVMAKALVWVRTGESRYRDEAIAAIRKAMGTEGGARTLAVGREVIAYVIAADLVGLPPADDAAFRPWLRGLLTRDFQGKTLVSTHDDRPNNWGTHAGASRLAIAAYLGDQAEFDRAATVFHGWVGNRSAYDGFDFKDLWWQADPSRPVGINPRGATKQGHSIDGVLPDDQRRGGSFTWPPPRENYVWEALQGALAQAVILHRAGHDVWNWEDRALLRAVEWLHEQANYPAEGDDTWQPYVINHYYGTRFPTVSPSRHGKNVGFTDWTHGGVATPIPPRPAAPVLLP
jgi:hypothetical protein